MILSIDPGTKQSGWVLFDGTRVRDSGTDENDAVLDIIRLYGGYIAAGLHEPVTLAIERFEARGMPLGDDSLETLIWTGRFIQAWHRPEEVKRVLRRYVKLHLCGSARAKDPNVRAALLDRFGGQAAAVGKKASPGPLYGVSSHAWAALAVAVTAREALAA